MFCGEDLDPNYGELPEFSRERGRFKFVVDYSLHITTVVQNRLLWGGSVMY